MLRKYLVVLVLVGQWAGTAHAQWQPGGVILTAAPNDQTQLAAAPDGLGGAIMTWYDTRNGTTSIYARRINAAGVLQWTVDGVAICTAANTQDHPEITTDGAGGAIITWQDLRAGNLNIFARRVNASGVPQWTADGVPICTATGNQELPKIMSDGAGGAFIAWSDLRSGAYDVYAQRVNGAGTTLWTANGVVVSNHGSNQLNPAMVSDGASGVILAWQDEHVSAYEIYAQLLNSSGVAQWTANGIQVGNISGEDVQPQITTDGAGGAIIAWVNVGLFDPGDVYVQRLQSLGVPWWNTPVRVAPANGLQSAPSIVADGSGGAMIFYHDDYGAGINRDIRGQRVNASGTLLWQGTGIFACIDLDDQYRPRAVADGAGGAVVVWNDHRGGPMDVWGQRIDASGNSVWTPNGIALGYGFNEQIDPVIVADGSGGSILAWTDNRSMIATDVYAQRIENTFGYWGHPEPLITSVADVPADQGGKVKINWTASDQDRATIRTITHYSVWRAVDPAAVAASSVVDGPAAVGEHFHGTATFREETPAIDYYWEWVGNQGAIFDHAYSFAAATRADSVATNLSVHQFRVVAHTGDAFVLFKSLPAFGYSVDNLAPAAPLFLTAQRVGFDVLLRWNRVKVPDLRDYSLYRATASGVTPVLINFLASADDTIAVDPNAPSSALYYIVTALDVHANQSPPSNEASVNPTTGIGDTPAITALTVLQNHPNPFRAATDFEVGLPRASDVSIEVFDVAGRRVSVLDVRGLGAGWQRIPFAGSDRDGRRLASGVYFYRVTAAGSTVTHKMVIAR